LMDSEVTNLAQVKAFDTTDYATSTQGTTADNALPLAGGTMTGDVSLGANVKAKFGASDDLEIYHDGSDSYIDETGTGNLRIKAQNFQVLGKADGEAQIEAYQNGGIYSYFDGDLKLATTSTGIDVTGSVTCDGFTSTGIDDNATSTAITINSSEDVTFSNAIIRGTGGGAGLANSYSIANKQTAANAFGFVAEASGNDAWLRMGHNGTEAVIETAWQTTAGTTPLIFKTNGVERLRINESSGGITFNGDTAAANALDDYETGTWTPGYNNKAGGGGSYTKIGDTVHCTAYLLTSVAGTAGTTITGLPFTANSSSNYRSGGVVAYNSGITASWTVLINGGGVSTFTLREGNTLKELSANTTAYLSFTYKV